MASGSEKKGLYVQVEKQHKEIVKNGGKETMEFFTSAVTVLQTLVVALDTGLGIWGAINLLEGYGNDNPGANAHVR